MKRLILIITLLATCATVAEASTPAAPTSAGGAFHWEYKPRFRCECGKDNPYSPWAYCLRKKTK